jgi:MtN3 and saliva related transmembrane protein
LKSARLFPARGGEGWELRLGESVFPQQLAGSCHDHPVRRRHRNDRRRADHGVLGPQAVRIIRSRETRAISLAGTLAFTVGIVFWLLYGLALVDWPLITSNAVTLGLMAVIVTLKLRHG